MIVRKMKKTSFLINNLGFLSVGNYDYMITYVIINYMLTICITV
jgi:hypothetical protein